MICLSGQENGDMSLKLQPQADHELNYVSVTEQVIFDCVRFLQLLYHKGLYHGDLRRPNIMCLGGRGLVIDYGFVDEGRQTTDWCKLCKLFYVLKNGDEDDVSISEFALDDVGEFKTDGAFGIFNYIFNIFFENAEVSKNERNFKIIE